MKNLLAVVLVFTPQLLIAQDDVIEVVQSPTVEIVTDGGNPFAGTYIVQKTELPPELFQILQAPKVLAELELVGEQKADLAARINKLTRAVQEKQQFLHQNRDRLPDAADQLLEVQRKYAEDVNAVSKDVLLPFQLERLKQIRLQAELCSRGSRAVESDGFADVLQLTEEQKDALRIKAAAAEKSLEREIRELRHKRHREVLDNVLTKEQLKALDQQLGDPLADSGR